MKNSIVKNKLIELAEKSNIDIRQLLNDLPANNHVNTSRTNELLELNFLVQFVNMQMLVSIDKKLSKLNETVDITAKDVVKLLNTK